jgi:cytochrome b
MIIALLLTVALVGASGWLYTTDRFWGVEWVEILHSKLADLLLILAGVHVLGALYTSFRHRENLVAALIHGHKRAF